MENLIKNFDVVVVGAGTGGTTAARFCAQNGLDVCLIDRKVYKKIGDKICGDGVGSDIFDMLKINHPKGDELSCRIKGAKLYSPNMEKCLDLIDPKQAGYVVNRLEFGQRLLDEALDAGVKQFLDEALAIDLLYKDNTVSGVKIKLKSGVKIDLKSKILIDASGLNSPLRKKTRSPLIEKNYSKEDAILCFREIVSFPTKDQEVDDLEYITIILDQENAPGGYIWYFPKNRYSVNIGLGVFMEYRGKVKDFYKEKVFKRFVKTPKVEILSSGGGVCPVRRPSWSCAENGFMLVGDAGFQVNPLHGGGIDPSMRAGYHAANMAKEAIENNDYSINKLWNYNYKIMSTFGAEFAALDLLRIALQKLSNKSLNFGLQRDLLSSEEILELASTGNVKLTLSSAFSKLIKGISNPKLLLDLNFLRVKMNNISKHYKNFPQSVENFEPWKEKTIELYNIIKKSTYG